MPSSGHGFAPGTLLAAVAAHHIALAVLAAPYVAWREGGHVCCERTADLLVKCGSVSALAVFVCERSAWTCAAADGGMDG